MRKLGTFHVHKILPKMSAVHQKLVFHGAKITTFVLRLLDILMIDLQTNETNMNGLLLHHERVTVLREKEKKIF